MVHSGPVEDYSIRPYPALRTPLTRLAPRVSPKSCQPHSFGAGPWTRHHLPSEHLVLDTSNLFLFCHGGCPSDREGNPIATASCAASYKGKVPKTLTLPIGPRASARDAAFQALTLATTTAGSTLRSCRAIKTIKIYSTDPTIPTQCLDPNAKDQGPATTAFSQAVTEALDTHQRLSIQIGWIPPGKGLTALQRAEAAAAEAVRSYRPEPTPAPKPSSSGKISGEKPLDANPLTLRSPPPPGRQDPTRHPRASHTNQTSFLHWN